MAVDAAGNVYFADYYNQRIRKLTVSTGLLTTVAGSGTVGYQGDGGLATAASLYYPTGVTVDGAGALYIPDSNDNRVRKVAPPTVATLTLSTIAGTGTAGYNGDGPATAANLYYPEGVAADAAGNVYIADTSDDRIQKSRSGDRDHLDGGRHRCRRILPERVGLRPRPESMARSGWRWTLRAMCTSRITSISASGRLPSQPESSPPSRATASPDFSGTVGLRRRQNCTIRRRSLSTGPAICTSPTATTIGFGR